MSAYIALRKQVYTQGRFRIQPLEATHRMAIMQWRNEQIYHLRQAKPLTQTDQDRYFAEVVSGLYNQTKPPQILFSFFDGDDFVAYGGLVHINWVDGNAEISFLMDTSREAERFSTYWQGWLGLIEQVAFHDLQLHKLYTYAFDVRPHLYPMLESCGYHREAELKEHCHFHGEWKSVVIHSKINRP